MKYFSTFSGIGGFEKGIQNAGLDWQCVGFSEIDKYATAIYQYQFPNHTNYGDITAIPEHDLPDFDLFVGGFPCQAFSVAGKRQGFEDTRGTLFFDVARILSAKRPEWIVLENVKGLLNHDSGRTIARIYRVLTELGYTVGWEVVNSCHFGVPQNRERIFIIGHLGGGSIGKIFPIGEKHPGVTKGASKTAITRTFTAGGNSGGKHSSMTLIADSGQGRKWEEREICPPLRAGSAPGQHERIISGTWRTHKDGEGFREIESGLAPTIPARAREDGSGQPVVQVRPVLTPDRPEKRQNGRRFKEDGEPMFTLTSQDRHGIAITEATKKGYDIATEGDSINLAVPNSATRRGRVGKGIANTLDTSCNQGTLHQTRIRRLTPVECERLQSFPDGWTALGNFDGETKEISDTQRYKTLGNSITVNVIEAIMRKIKQQL